MYVEVYESQDALIWGHTSPGPLDSIFHCGRRYPPPLRSHLYVGLWCVITGRVEPGVLELNSFFMFHRQVGSESHDCVGHGDSTVAPQLISTPVIRFSAGGRVKLDPNAACRPPVRNVTERDEATDDCQFASGIEAVQVLRLFLSCPQSLTEYTDRSDSRINDQKLPALCENQ